MKRLSGFIVVILVVILVGFSFSGCATNNTSGEGENGSIIEGENGNVIEGENGNITEDDENQNGGEEDNSNDNEIDNNINNYFFMIRAKTNSLNIRSKPTTASTSLGYINNNDMVIYEGEENGFYKTIYRNQTAYVSANSRYTELIKYEKQAEHIQGLIDLGARYLGTPYVWGAERYHWGNGNKNYNFTDTEFDCSSLTQYIYYKVQNVLLDTTSRTQSVQGEYVGKDNLKIGDLMFFTNSSRYHLSGIERVGHVGIYFGDNYILHTASDYAVIEPISSTRWSYFMHARRHI